MDYHIISSPLDKVEYLFFAASLKHRGLFYKLAVAEQLGLPDNAYTGRYEVLMQSETGTFHFDLYKNEHDTWVSEPQSVNSEIVFLIGAQIETVTA